MYPIKFENLYYQNIWGGRDFEAFRNNLPDGVVGESWDISCHKSGMGIVENGELKGKTFEEIIKEYGHDLVGSKISTEKFPLLVKLINAREKLSVQVHPNDEYAARVENQYGKTEAWYVVKAEEGAKLIVGTKDCTKEEFEKAIKENKTMDLLNIITVKEGDSFLINSGLVHAICEGVIIAEIQQNSDVTYRVYDYGRPREIHVEKALDVIDFNLQSINIGLNEEVKKDGYTEKFLCENEYFGITKIMVSENFKESSNKDRFFILTNVKGNGIVKYSGGEVDFNYGDSILIPATLGEYEVLGQVELLKSYAI